MLQNSPHLLKKDANLQMNQTLFVIQKYIISKILLYLFEHIYKIAKNTP
jgi:hypothetical protein